MNVFEFQAATLGRAADDVAGTFAACKMGLAKSAFDINQGTALADLQAAHSTFTGYAKLTVVWGAPAIGSDGEVEVVSTELTFTPTDSVGGDQAAFCFWVEDSTAALLYFAGAFDAPIPMNGALNFLRIQLRYRPRTRVLVVLVY